jgi:hypothetical protein
MDGLAVFHSMVLFVSFLPYCAQRAEMLVVAMGFGLSKDLLALDSLHLVTGTQG